MKKLFLVRHADYSCGTDPGLSESGKKQSLNLAKKIKAIIEKGNVVIWTSTAKRAYETAQIIKQEMQLADLVKKEKLWSDNDHDHDFDWLKNQLNSFNGENLIIVSHLEYVRQFPEEIGFSENNSGYAEGIIIHEGKCVNL